ncbi:hypothetical protein Bca52824_086511 [Brassica carinata]|uniref:Uncharacterized protein n=1 Tax=Brassica carinata TaxID=52824 RepID=A0A8X7PA28_BRACI|nr:hypothetical protein Bca52824_086511 [Brassica carinata]
MSSKKGSSKRNSSSHSSSGDSSANEVIAPKEEFEVEEEAKDAYYKALCSSPPPSQDIPIPKRPVRHGSALFFVRIDGESVEENYLHLFRREWNFTRGNTNNYVFRFDTLKTCVDDFFFIILQ